MSKKRDVTIEVTPIVRSFLNHNEIPVGEPGVAELILLEESLLRLRQSHSPEEENRRAAILNQHFARFLEQRLALLQKRQVEEKQRARMQELAMKLSESMSIIPSAYRNDQHIMRYPLFATSQMKRFEPIEYEFIDKNGDRRFITVTANAKYGMADQRDADILRYALTKMGEVFLKTGYAAPYVKVSPYELLRGIGKDAGVKGYGWLGNGIRRLAGMLIETNILTVEPKNPRSVYMGSLVTFEFESNPDKTGLKARTRIIIHASPVLYRSVALGGLLCIDRSVMQETGNLRKALLERVQVFLGNKQFWSIDLRKFAELCALDLELPLWRFKQEINRAKLPYSVSYHRNTFGQEIVTFARTETGSQTGE